MSQIVSYLNSCHGNRAVRECGVVFNCGVNPNQALTHSLTLMVFPSRRVYFGQAFGRKGLAVSSMHVLRVRS